MSTVLVAWELGGGLGHLMRLKPVVRGLVRRGHRVVAIVQDVVRARRVFDVPDICLLPAPVAKVPAHMKIKLIRSYGHILHNSGFGDKDTLAVLLASWRSLIDLVEPDLILCDHSPTVLLAARGCAAKRLCLGTGFCCPPAETPFRDLRPEIPIEKGRLDREESQLLQTVNSTLVDMGLSRLDQLSDLYRDIDASVLTTYRELDHYPDRHNAEYWGVWSKGDGLDADWPQGEGKRIFAYLKPFPSFPSLINKLESIGCPTIVYAKGISPSLRQRLSSSKIRFMADQVDLAQVGRSCDFAILGGGHGATASLLLSGKPILQIPRYLEQSMTAQAIVRMHAGLAVSRKDSKGVDLALDRLLSDNSYNDGANCFAKKYASHRGEEALHRFFDLCERLLSPNQEITNRE